MKLGYITEEADKSSRRAARVTEQLDASQAANSEMEAELRRLKVQADQWRKAAEAAASMLSTGNNNGKFVERTGSLDSSNNVNYTTIAGAMVGSPFSEDMDDDSMKKKNGNVLKKIGVFWKKGH
ncbi:Interactor of constitutive active ROPs 3 [Linum perenne]